MARLRQASQQQRRAEEESAVILTFTVPAGGWTARRGWTPACATLTSFSCAPSTAGAVRPIMNRQGCRSSACSSASAALPEALARRRPVGSASIHCRRRSGIVGQEPVAAGLRRTCLSAARSIPAGILLKEPGGSRTLSLVGCCAGRPSRPPAHVEGGRRADLARSVYRGYRASCIRGGGLPWPITRSGEQCRPLP